ncbi:MAG TPA: PIN domain-containing protein [Isosphaeraceae bacterium]|jgi:predicted nucleic acid-binding protein|nr:PIN domain-containing protein [Isosphaeraceae bacterium]
MDVLHDINIVIDVLEDRAPFAEPAAALWAKAEARELRASLAATTLTTVYYITRKSRGDDVARRAIADLLRVFDILPVNRAVLEAALVHPSRDFEDAVQDAAAELAGIAVVVTRDPAGFAGSTRRVVDAATFVAELEARPD